MMPMRTALGLDMACSPELNTLISKRKHSGPRAPEPNWCGRFALARSGADGCADRREPVVAGGGWGGGEGGKIFLRVLGVGGPGGPFPPIVVGREGRRGVRRRGGEKNI